MATRRQEKVARVVKEEVSEVITNHLNDPRIEGFVSITHVDISADLRIANVFVSVFGGSEAAQNRTFEAIRHAQRRIQTLLAGRIKSKFCPVLHFRQDDKFKKTLETMRLIEEATRELEQKEANDQTQSE